MRQKMSDPRAKGKINQQSNEPLQLPEYDEPILEENTNTGISLTSMRRAGRYMWIAIIFMIVSILIVVGYMFLYNSSIVSAERQCWVEQQQIEALANRYVVDNGFSSLPAYVEDVPAFDQIYVDCPSGGTYTWNPVLGQYSCSEHGHYPEGFNQAQSSISSQKTITIVNESQ